MISKDIVETLKQRAKEMLNDDYSRKIGDEELYTIICEWENSLKELETYKKIAEKLAEDKIIPKCKNCSEDTHECTECALEWARNEVKNSEKI